MSWFISQSLFLILAAFLLGLLVGWLVWGTRKRSLPPLSEAAVARPGEAENSDNAAAPTAHAEPRQANLATIEAGGRRVTGGQDVRPAVKGDGTQTTDGPTANKPSTTTAEPAATPTKPVTTAVEPADTQGDELERIEGIGAKMASALRAAGIHTFRQLAEADDDTRRAAIEAAGLTFAPSLITWGRQARLLADGDEAGFAELTELLVAGRDTGRA
ncbi:helix-hairpin-helix domain-containing protein [Micromonosporaceae bacterium B7E4]